MNRKFLLVVLGAATAVAYAFSADGIGSGEFEDGTIHCNDEYNSCDVQIGDIAVTRWLTNQKVSVTDIKNRAQFRSVGDGSDDEQSFCGMTFDGKYEVRPVRDCKHLRNYLPAFNKIFATLGTDQSNWIDLYKDHTYPENDKKQSYTRVTRVGSDVDKRRMYITELSTPSSDGARERCSRGSWMLGEQLPVDECASLRKYIHDFDNLGQELARIKSQQKASK